MDVDSRENWKEDMKAAIAFPCKGEQRNGIIAEGECESNETKNTFISFSNVRGIVACLHIDKNIQRRGRN